MSSIPSPHKLLALRQARGLARQGSVLATSLLLICLSSFQLVRAELADVERKRLEQLTNSVQKAGQLFASGEYLNCVSEVERSQAGLLELLQSRQRSLDPELLRAAKPIYDRLQKAHSLLELHGAVLKPLPAWPELTTQPRGTTETEDAAQAMSTDKNVNAPPLPTTSAETFNSGGSSGRSAASTPPQNSTSSISFSQQIAPILLENCNGCHIDGRRASGNLRMDNYAQLMAGGDSGELIAGRNATASLLVQRISDEVEPRMPAGGRPPLTDEQIALISNWIREGAKFDGGDPNSALRNVVQESWAASASHDELFAKRREQSLERWKRVLPDTAPSTAQNSEVFVMGNVTQDEVDQVLAATENALLQSKKLLGTPKDAPLVKGGLGIFVLQSRYDYNEFGRMNENRDLPNEWSGHWRGSPLEAYAVIVSDPERSEKASQSLTLEVLVGAYLGSFRDVPFWFAEGVARNAVVNTFRRADPRVRQWQANLGPALAGFETANELLDDRLDEESAGLVGMALTNAMMSKANRQRFEKLLSFLREGKAFPDAVTFSYAPPEMLVKNWLGKK